jgi:hypothetical protein
VMGTMTSTRQYMFRCIQSADEIYTLAFLEGRA